MGPGVQPAFSYSVRQGFRITVFKCFKTSEMSLFPTLGVTMGEIKLVTNQWTLLSALIT